MKQLKAALVCLAFLAGQRLAGQSVLISEIMYHPPGPDQDLEYVEIYNETASPLDISGYCFTKGISYRFAGPPHSERTWIEPYEYIVVAKNPDAFEAEYGFRPYGPFGSGPYLGQRSPASLEDGGEPVAISNGALRFRETENGREFVHSPVVSQVEYGSGERWPASCRGAGHSLCLLSPEKAPEERNSWAPSPFIGGTPGAANGCLERTYKDTTLVPEGDSWKFKRGIEAPSDPIGEWREPAFDDSAWGADPAGFGYGDGDDATVLEDMEDNYLTVYIRKKFTVESPSKFDELVLHILFDDGFVAYLNGHELVRQNVSSDPPLHTDEASGNHEAPDDPGNADLFDVSESLPRLKQGENVLCVQGHNRTISNADFSLNPWLVAREEITPSSVGVVINEVYYTGAGEDWIEFYNPTGQAVDLSGYYISCDPSDLKMFEIPGGTQAGAGEFLVFKEGDLGFELSSGSKSNGSGKPLLVLLTSPGLDAVVRSQSFSPGAAFGTSRSRVPDGKGRWFTTYEPTMGEANKVELEEAVVINELMYHPFHAPNPYNREPQEEPEDREYIELFNTADYPVDLSGWRLTGGVRYTFPGGTLLGGGQYLLIVNDPGTIGRIYGISEHDMFGPYDGRLSNRGELICLRDSLGNAVDEVRYYDGGRWPRWPDGRGASLELIDPRQDNSVPSAWASSEEGHKSEWTKVTFSGRHAGGESELAFLLTHAGEMLLDDVHVSSGGFDGTNIIKNSDFEQGLSGWEITDGVHEQSKLYEGEGHSGSSSLHVISTGLGDNWNNNIEYDPWSPSLRGGRTYYVSYWAKWLRGNNWFLVRGHSAGLNQSYVLAHCAQIPVPENLGTPGARNSVYLENQGPVIARLNQDPVVPKSSDSVDVTCYAFDAGGIESMKLFYHRDTSGDTQSVEMFDDGLHKDGSEGDGIWGGEIPPFSDRRVVVFWIVGRDAQGVSSTFPPKGDEEPAAYQVWNRRIDTNLPFYRIIQRRRDENELWSRIPMSQSLVPATFVYNNKTIYYNVGMRFRGSPWIRPGHKGAGYRVRFNRNKLLNGRLYEMNLDQQYQRSSKMMERTAYYLMRCLSKYAGNTVLPYSLQQFVVLHYDRESPTAQIYEEVQKVGRNYIKYWYGEDNRGSLYKLDDWFECNNDGNPQQETDANLVYHGNNKETYRWFFKKRSNEKWDDYDKLIQFCRFLSRSSTEEIKNQLPERVDINEWLGILAVRFYIGDWDTLGYNRGKNAYIYLPCRDRRWQLLPWDSDLVFQNGELNAGILPHSSFPGVQKMFTTNSENARRLYRFYWDLINGPADLGFIGEFHSRTYETWDREPRSWGMGRPTGIQSFMRTRNQNVELRINRGDFELREPSTSPYSAENREIELVGTAPASVSDIQINGESIYKDVQWERTTRWVYTLSLPEDEAVTLNIVAYNSHGEVEGEATLEACYSTAPAPEIVSITPGECSDQGGCDATVKGNHFMEGASAFFAGIEAPETTFVDSETLKVQVPAPAEEGKQFVDCVVQNPDLKKGVLSNGFQYIPEWPAVLSAVPASAAPGGGKVIQIYGERFQEGMRVSFGGVESPSVEVENQFSAKVEVPQLCRVGKVEVRAENPDGKTSAYPLEFTIEGELPDPVIERAVPNAGSVTGGETVEIQGNWFYVEEPSSVVVIFGTKTATVQEASCKSIAVTAPDKGSPGSVTIIVTDSAGRTAMKDGAYTYGGNGGSTFVRGEIDGDGTFTINDALSILRKLFGAGNFVCEDAADVDDNGKLEVSDCIYLLNYLFANGPAPPPPFPSEGIDPTADSLSCKQYP